MKTKILLTLLLLSPFIFASILLPNFSLRFIIPILYFPLLIAIAYRYKLSRNIIVLTYWLLLIFFIIDISLIIFQGSSFDFRFFNQLTLENLVIASQQYPQYLLAISLILITLLIASKKTINLIIKNKTYNNYSFVPFLILNLGFILILPSSISSFTMKKINLIVKAREIKNNIQLSNNKLESTVGKNLLFIFLESYEMEYTEKINFPSLTPFLQELKKESIVFNKYYRVEGASSSTSAIFTSMNGAPYQYKDSKNIIGLGNVLKSSGYHQVFMQGSEMKYGGIGKLFLDQGYNELYGKKDLPPINGHGYNSWGTRDEDLFTYAYSKIKELDSSKKPYNLTLFTNDTHNGEPSTICDSIPKYLGVFDENNFFQSYYCTDYLLNKFIGKVRSLPNSNNLVIVIVGDHLQNFDSYGSFLNKMDRRVFAIINLPNNQHEDINFPTSHIHLAPTILSSMGVKSNVEFLLGKNMLNPLNRDSIKPTYEKEDKYYNPIISNNSKETVGKIIMTDYKLDIYRNSIKGIDGDQLTKYYLSEIETFKNFSTDEVDIYYSLDDNILFTRTKKKYVEANFSLIGHFSYDKNNSPFSSYNGKLLLKDAYKLPNGWLSWVFGSSFKDVSGLEFSIKEISNSNYMELPINISPLNTGSKLLVKTLSTELNFINDDPLPGDRSGMVLTYSNNSKHVKFFIEDLYPNNYPNRIKYNVIYNDKVIYSGDIGDRIQKGKELIKVSLLDNDKNIYVNLEALKGLEKWGWGKMKIKVSFSK